MADVADIERYREKHRRVASPAHLLVCDTLGDAAIVHALGDLDLSVASELERSLESGASTARAIVLDLSACNYFDSAIIRVLIRAVQRWEGRFAVVAPHEHVTRRILRLAGLETTLPLEPNVVSACARAHAPGPA